MAVALGKTVYNLGQDPCSGVWIKWNCEELDAALEGPVKDFVSDAQGMADIRNALTANLTDFEDTGFGREQLDSFCDRFLNYLWGHAFDSINEDSWRKGEAIAQIYLFDHRACCFPWPASRDERRRGSNLPGADMIGFRKDEKDHCFVFGEVKTSSEKKYPPSLMYGDHGFQQQLTDLRDRQDLRHTLIVYLSSRMTLQKSIPLRDKFKHAATRYLADSSDFQLYGFMVRDTTPCKRDLRRCVKNLANGLNGLTRIELFALYLPKGGIRKIGKAYRKTRAEAS